MAPKAHTPNGRENGGNDRVTRSGTQGTPATGNKGAAAAPVVPAAQIVPILPVAPAAVAIQTAPTIRIGTSSVRDFGVGTYQDVEGHRTELLQSLTTTQATAEDQNWLREALLEK
jgi:hypothetical protein